MCQVILMLPLLTLPIFWLAPGSFAAPVYGVILVALALMYFYAIHALGRAVCIGAEGTRHETGRVIAADGTRARVRVESEVWTAISQDLLCEGDFVRIENVDGLVLRVRRLPAEAPPPPGLRPPTPSGLAPR